MATRELSDILESVVDGMDKTMTITDVTDNLDGTTTIAVCDAKYTEAGRSITIDGVGYVVQAVDYELNTITVTTGDPILVSEFMLYDVFFFHGTQYDTENQVKEIQNATDKTPMVFLLIPYTERFSEDETSAIEREARFSLFFLTQANFDNWPTVVAMEKAIKPTSALKDLFIQRLKDLSGVFMPDSLEHTRTPRPRFGVYVSNKGVISAWQAMDLSGIQEDFNALQIIKGHEANCPCSPIRTGIGNMEIEQTFIIA